MPMNSIPRRRLGRTNLMVSELGLGGYQFTGEFGVPRTEALAILRQAFAAGINYVDTAPLYGCGESEELVGRARQAAGIPLIVSTKVGHLDRTIVRYGGDAAYRDEALLHRVVAHSLHLLRADHVEILMIHEPEWPRWGLDRRTGDGPVMRVCEQLKRDGVITAIGLGGWDCDFMADMIETGRVDVVLTVMHYDLAVQDARERLLPLAEKHDVGVIVGGPFRQGALAFRQPEAVQRMRQTGQFDHGFNEQVLAKIGDIYALADEFGIELPELGIRYLLSDPRVATVIPGPRTTDQLRANLLAASRGPLPADLLARVERLGS